MELFKWIPNVILTKKDSTYLWYVLSIYDIFARGVLKCIIRTEQHFKIELFERKK